ncbi:putative lipid II flippase FtsW [Actinomarinicola tropica]|uniref:Probable peptidoglycan glycosyltransferase FtsW n=1 Tax=Actinomarinicola tropica TaxID=2789776 RepID=A0A5Q2RN78_9ACTN|nr:putative lipid II flippase FtsW [Actinomarinicola tropica]QGG95547.1 putative lipid II flippase FtsW [Actinomarinicola tropica]
MTVLTTRPERSRPRLRLGRPSGRRTGVFLGLLTVVLLLCVVGLVMVMSASSVVGLYQFGSSWYFVKRQVIWLAVGLVVLVVTMRIDYRLWRRLASPLLLGSIVALGLVLVPGIGVSVYGSTRWLGAGPIQIQPSEFAKLGLILFIADLLARRAHRIGHLRLTLQPVLIMAGIVCALLMLQPNLGTTMVTGAIVGAMLLVSGMPLLPLAGISMGAAVTAVGLALAAPYRRARVSGFLDPWADPRGEGYQTIQSLIGTAQGGWLGVGLGASRSKWGFLPFAHTDFVFAIIAEETGLLGASAVVLLVMALCWLGVAAALRAPDRFGTLLAVGITTWLAAQAFVNIGAVVGILPITGVPLPFVSFGGSSMLSTMAATGILLNVARQARGGATLER